MSNISDSESEVILPNPFTPMAFLPPEVAFQSTIKTYVAVGTTAVLIWDILSHLSEDYQLLTLHPIKIPTITYFVSRISNLLYIVACVIFNTAPISHCVELGRYIDWSLPVVQSSTSLLFFLRVWAVYHGNYIVRTFFAITWLAVFGSTFTVGIGMVVGNIGTTSYCIYTRSTPYIALTFIMPLVHDTLVFISITWILSRNTYVDYNLSRGFRMVVFGDYLPIFSKSLLQDGQMYYLTTLTTSVLTVVLFYMPFAPSYKILFSLPNIVLMNIMACRVYRKTKLGFYDHQDGSSIETAQMCFNTPASTLHGPVIPLSLPKKPQGLHETHMPKQGCSTSSGMS